MEAFRQFLTKDPPIRIVRASVNMNIKGIRKAIKNKKEEQEQEQEGQDKFQLNVSVETETKIETETETETKPESTPLSIYLSELRLSNKVDITRGKKLNQNYQKSMHGPKKVKL